MQKPAQARCLANKKQEGGLQCRYVNFPTHSAGYGRRGTRIPKEPASNRLLYIQTRSSHYRTRAIVDLVHGQRRSPH